MKTLLWAAGIAGVMFTFAAMAPDKPRPARAAELCDDGKALMARAGASYEQAQRLGCDRAAQVKAYDSLYERAHGK